MRIVRINTMAMRNGEMNEGQRYMAICMNLP